MVFPTLSLHIFCVAECSLQLEYHTTRAILYGNSKTAVVAEQGLASNQLNWNASDSSLQMKPVPSYSNTTDPSRSFKS
ncbi:hypothetical protein FN846DRAFT_949187 [Sphaerosporella brunnea]|uniref:Uncharacterized protein n=1 Tax=Sphaerosporella brunnea TaxID=1250544 RepID=A0A5J5EWB0_9PEZI|nr:hypothetical protein FN846DRAFT_949187 [Sphaerosporella brunnea]